MSATTPRGHVPRHVTASSWWRRVLRGAVAGTLVLAILLGAGLVVQAWRVQHALQGVQHFSATGPAGRGQSGGVELDLPPPLKGVTTFLLFTTGSRGMTAAEARRYHIHGLDGRGEDGLTDTLMVVVVDTKHGQIRYLSIPRDTWLPQYGVKINQLYDRYGVTTLVDEVQHLTGVPINHVAALGFTAFGRFTDAAGGVDIYVPVPTRDAKSGLLVTSPGCTHMDGWEALAFARSRHTQVQVDGVWRTDPGASDFQRVTRQQVIADAFVHKLLTPKLPLMADDLASAVADEVTTDKDLTIGTVISTGLALAKHGVRTRHFVLPSRAGFAGSASVTFVQPAPAARVLTDFGEGVPGFALPRDLPAVAGAGSGASSPAAPSGPAAPAGSGSAPDAATTAPGASTTPGPSVEVLPEGVTLTRTARYRVCG